MKQRWIAAAAWGLLGLPSAGPCVAQTAETPGAVESPAATWIDEPSSAPPQVIDPGPAYSNWRPEAFLAFATGDEGEVFAAHVGAAYLFDPVNHIELVPQVGFGVARNTDDDQPLISSFDLQFRWTTWERGGWDVFFEGGGGLQYVGPESFPRSGTHFNGRLRVGVGARYELEERLDFIGGINWLHMSNGNALPNNVGHDGPMFFLGLTWRY